MPAWQWQNGQWHSVSETGLPPISHTSLIAVFTTLAWPVLPAVLATHMRRLAAHAKALRRPSLSIDYRQAGLQRLINLLPAIPVRLRLSLTQQGNWFADTSPLPIAPPQTMLIAQAYTHPYPRIKHNQRSAIPLWHNDQPHPVWVNDTGHLTESPIATLGGWMPLSNEYRHKYALWLPPKAMCLASITRRQWINAAHHYDIPVLEIPLTPTEAQQQLHGIMLGNSLRGTWPVEGFNHHDWHWPRELQAQYDHWHSVLPTVIN